MINWHAFANPKRFLSLSGSLRPWFLGLALMGLVGGVGWGLLIAPPDYQQGESVRIMYLHVPSAWLSLFTYTSMALASALFLVWKHPLASLAAQGIAPIGATVTALCLLTGMIWGKPTWGVWWVWDARLTSVLLLFFLFLGYMLLRHSFSSPQAAEKPCAALAILGVINIPIIKYSVEWWTTLHQPASLSSFERLGAPAIDPSMLWPLLISALGFFSFCLWLWLLRIETLIYKSKASNRKPLAHVHSSP